MVLAADRFQVAAFEEFTLWQVENNGAEWLELRGPKSVLRASRVKARLLVNSRDVLQSWADGGNPEKRAVGLSVTTATRFGKHELEFRYCTWRPLRVSRPQARALLALMDHIIAFIAQ